MAPGGLIRNVWTIGCASIHQQPNQFGGWKDTNISHLPERKPELPGHGAVEDEVDHAVHKGHHVHQLQEKEKGCFQKTK